MLAKERKIIDNPKGKALKSMGETLPSGRMRGSLDTAAAPNGTRTRLTKHNFPTVKLLILK